MIINTNSHSVFVLHGVHSHGLAPIEGACIGFEVGKIFVEFRPSTEIVEESLHDKKEGNESKGRDNIVENRINHISSFVDYCL